MIDPADPSLSPAQQPVRKHRLRNVILVFVAICLVGGALRGRAPRHNIKVPITEFQNQPADGVKTNARRCIYAGKTSVGNRGLSVYAFRTVTNSSAIIDEWSKDGQNASASATRRVRDALASSPRLHQSISRTRR